MPHLWLSFHTLNRRFGHARRGSRSDAPTVEVTEYATWQLDVKWLEGWLAQAPQGKALPEARNSSFIVDLPMPMEAWSDSRSSTAPHHGSRACPAAPEIQVYAGQGVDRPEATVRFDDTPGFHAMILGEGETVYIDPYHPGERNTVISYTRSAFYASTSKQPEGCMALDVPTDKPSDVMDAHPGGKQVKTYGRPAVAVNRVDNGSQLRTYRLALACTGSTPRSMGERSRACLLR